MLSMDNAKSKESSRLPEVFIRSEKFAILTEHGEPHSIRVRLQHLIPAPKHIAIHVIMDVVLPTEHEMLVCDDVIVSGWDGPGINGLRVGACV